MKRFSFLLLVIFSISFSQAQILEPVSWEFSSEYLGDDEFNIIHTATIDEGWHMYSQDIADGGPVPTSFTFEENRRAEYIGKVIEKGEKIDKFDKLFDMQVAWYDNSVQFIQKVKLNKPRTTIKGMLEFMVCDAEQCLPPEEVEFEHKLKVPTFGKDKKATGTDHSLQTSPAASGTAVASAGNMIDNATSSNGVDLGTKKSSDILDPVKWRFRSVQVKDNSYDIFLDATIEEGWYIYSQDVEDGGPIPTSFVFDENEDIRFELAKPEEISKYSKEGIDKIFDVFVKKFQNEVSFRTRVNVTGEATALTGALEFQTCDDEKCLPPNEIEFSFPLIGKGGEGGERAPEPGGGSGKPGVQYIIPSVDLENPVSNCSTAEISSGDSKDVEDEGSNFWLNFFKGVFGGLLALLTPCVFPMIPLTVSFFTKGSKERSKGIFNAVTYGLFIFLIYVLFSVPFHLMESVSPDIFSEISTNPYLNIFFFIIFIAFAFSFLGFFEIQMPTWLTNRADSASNSGGLAGIFFMAITLALVSFSCTGPILGTLLADTIKSEGAALQLSAGMAGFGLALGVPFALFALFPGWLNSLPKSGGWMDSVKKFLGFLELGMAVKFLANADNVMRWGILKREVFFALWIIVAILLALWLFGVLKLPHDTPGKKGITRLSIGALTLAFIVYLLPGLSNTEYANLRLLSGMPPPLHYSIYNDSKCPLDLNCRKDYQDGLALAKETNKPILIDFTGWACANCRRMEENVWVEPEIFKRLNEDFVVISLYVDDKVKLEDEKAHTYETSYGKMINVNKVGKQWQLLQTETFGNNSQPWYVLLSPDEVLLNQPVGNTPDADEYQDFLDCGLAAFEQLEAQDGTTSL